MKMLIFTKYTHYKKDSKYTKIKLEKLEKDWKKNKSLFTSHPLQIHSLFLLIINYLHQNIVLLF